jgi:hypothetical protein
MRNATVFAACVLSLRTDGEAAVAQAKPQMSEKEQVTEVEAIFPWCSPRGSRSSCLVLMVLA